MILKNEFKDELTIITNIILRQLRYISTSCLENTSYITTLPLCLRYGIWEGGGQNIQ